MIDTTDVAGGGRTVTLSDLVRIPLRRWPTVLVAAVLGVLGALAWLWVVPASYEAVAVVAVRPVVADPFSYPGPGADRTVNMNVENGLATGTRVADAVAVATGRSPAAARAALQVEIPVGSQVLRFAYTGRTATEAVDGANAASRAYLQVRGGIYEDQRANQLTAYDEAIKSVTDRQTALRRSLPGSPPRTGASPPGVTATVEQLRALNDEHTRLSEERARLAAVDITPGTITRVAARPVPSSHDSAPIQLAVGLLGGALLGIIAAYGRESLDRRIRSMTDAEQVIGLPALATVRRPRRADLRPDTDLRYAALVLAEQLDGGARSAVLLASRAGEGRERLLAGLATALADQGYGVRVVDVEDQPIGSVAPAPRTGGGPAPAPPAARTGAGGAVGRTGSAAVTEPDLARGSRHVVAPTGSTAPAGRPESLDVAGQLLLEEAGLDSVDRERVESLAPPPVRNRATAIGTARVPTGPVAEPEAEPAPESATERLAGADPGTVLVLVDAPPAESDERGVRAARDAAAVLVVARDLTRTGELRRLTERLRLTGARTLGFIFLIGRG